MNVVIWARVSSREQREGYSIDAQIRFNRDRAQANGWNVVREYVVAESAKRGAERLAFNEMFAWVKANARKQKIKAILSHKLDRVCRNMRDAVRLQELEDACGVELAFVDNQFGPGAAGALSFNVMAAVAQYYSDNLRSEVLKGLDEKVRQGWPTGIAPYGYINVDDRDEPVVPHPENSRTLVRLFQLYSTGSHTFKSLADLLESEGHIFRKSQPRFGRTALAQLGDVDPARAETALALFDWTQNAAEIWRGSNNRVRREILDAVCLNRTLGDVNLDATKRKPFDVFAKGLEIKNSRDDKI